MTRRSHDCGVAVGLLPEALREEDATPAVGTMVHTWYPENAVAEILPHHAIPAGTDVLRPGVRGKVLWIRCWVDEITERPTVSIMAEFGGVWRPGSARWCWGVSGG